MDLKKRGGRDVSNVNTKAIRMRHYRDKLKNDKNRKENDDEMKQMDRDWKQEE